MKKKPFLLHPSTEIEVVLRKYMSYSDYEKNRKTFKKKGWKCQAYQKEVYSDGLKKAVQ